MTPEEFFVLLGEAQFYKVKGKARLTIIHGMYMAYCRAYLAKGFVDFYKEVGNGGPFQAYKLAAKHRDEGTPMIIIAEFMS